MLHAVTGGRFVALARIISRVCNTRVVHQRAYPASVSAGTRMGGCSPVLARHQELRPWLLILDGADAVVWSQCRLASVFRIGGIEATEANGRAPVVTKIRLV